MAKTATRRKPAAEKGAPKKPAAEKVASKKPAAGKVASKKPATTLPRTIVATVPATAKMAKCLRDAEGCLPVIHNELRRALTGGPETSARAMVALHRLKDVVDGMAKQFGAVYSPFKSAVMPDVLEIAGLSNVPLIEGFRVGTSSTMYVSVRAGMAAEAKKWLRDHGLGDLVVETVNASTLAAAARVWLEEHNLDFPPHLFNVAYADNTSVTSTKQ